MIIVDFPNQFEKERDVLSEIPEEEFKNLVRKCIRILKDLLRERKFHGEGDIEEKKKRYEERANPLKIFIQKFCEIDPEGYIPSTEFYNRFVTWLKTEKPKFRIPNWKNEVKPYLEAEGFETGVRKYVNYEQKRCIVGLRWKDDNSHEENNDKPTDSILTKLKEIAEYEGTKVLKETVEEKLTKEEIETAIKNGWLGDMNLYYIIALP